MYKFMCHVSGTLASWVTLVQFCSVTMPVLLSRCVGEFVRLESKLVENKLNYARFLTSLVMKLTTISKIRI